MRQGAERSKTFDRAADARAWEAKVRMMKRGGALAELDAGTETLAEFVEEWWLVYAGPNLERSTLRTYAHAVERARARRVSGTCSCASSRRRRSRASAPSSRARASATRRSARR